MDKVTEKERELIKLLKEIEPEFDFILGVGLLTRENKNIDKVLKYLKETPNLTTDDVYEFALDN